MLFIVLEFFLVLGIVFVVVYVGFFLLGEIGIGMWGGLLIYWGGLFIFLLVLEFFVLLCGFVVVYYDWVVGFVVFEKFEVIVFGFFNFGGFKLDRGVVVNIILLVLSVCFDGVLIVYGEWLVFEDLIFDILEG